VVCRQPVRVAGPLAPVSAGSAGGSQRQVPGPPSAPRFGNDPSLAGKLRKNALQPALAASRAGPARESTPSLLQRPSAVDQRSAPTTASITIVADERPLTSRLRRGRFRDWTGVGRKFRGDGAPLATSHPEAFVRLWESGHAATQDEPSTPSATPGVSGSSMPPPPRRRGSGTGPADPIQPAMRVLVRRPALHDATASRPQGPPANSNVEQRRRQFDLPQPPVARVLESTTSSPRRRI